MVKNGILVSEGAKLANDTIHFIFNSLLALRCMNDIFLKCLKMIRNVTYDVDVCYSSFINFFPFIIVIHFKAS